jgi:CRISPR-associated endonuclease Csy4
MDHYQDIQLLPDPEVAPSHLMNALFAKLHHALVQLGNPGIGISFPDLATGNGTAAGLGVRLRLHGSAGALLELKVPDWLAGLRDHVQLANIVAAPADATHQTVRRIQAKSNPERLRRRQMKRKGWSAEQARAAIPDAVAEVLVLPYLTAFSQSTGQRFRLFVEQRPVAKASLGVFNAYGFSQTASLPCF